MALVALFVVFGVLDYYKYHGTVWIYGLSVKGGVEVL